MNGRPTACVALAALLTAACASTSNTDPGVGASPNHSASATTNAAPASVRAGALGFTLANFTGTALRAVYVSPNDSGGWEENVLGEGELRDGESVEIRFNPAEGAAAWDVKVEAVDGHFAEWKGLRLGGASRVTLHLDVVGERVVVAEIE
ncbi:MAG TPA: hypothetical protein VF588_07185 [Pyrinomonadaceae bacterium]